MRVQRASCRLLAIEIGRLIGAGQITRRARHQCLPITKCIVNYGAKVSNHANGNMRITEAHEQRMSRPTKDELGQDSRTSRLRRIATATAPRAFWQGVIKRIR
jgi:hypothetical protein